LITGLRGVRRAAGGRVGHVRTWSLARQDRIGSVTYIHRLACEDLPVDISQFRSWFDAKLIDESPACLLICMQGLSTSPGRGQREHEVGVEPFLQRMLRRHLQQLGDQFLMVAQPEPGIEAVLKHLEA
jgi:hypothetical protein